MEERREVKTFEVDYKCPKCDIGYLRPTGIICDNHPITYPHKCNNCDYTELIKGHKYPYLIYEPLFDDVYIKNGNIIDIIHRDHYSYGEMHIGDIMVKENAQKNEHSEIPLDLKDKSIKEIDNYVKKESGK